MCSFMTPKIEGAAENLIRFDFRISKPTASREKAIDAVEIRINTNMEETATLKNVYQVQPCLCYAYAGNQLQIGCGKLLLLPRKRLA